MYPTVADVLTLPVMRRGVPRVVAGASGLDRRVRWVHAAEVADIAHLLRGGELVLTTGIALPGDPAELTRYVDELAGVRAAGVVVELVRRWSDELPPALVAAAERRSLPLITLARETRFVAITEAVGALILDAQVEELRAAEAIHERFTALTVSGAERAEILREVVRLSGLPVVLETLNHTFLDYDAADENPTELLDDWEARSRSVVQSARTAYDEVAGWLVTVVGARGDDWGRLVLLSPQPPSHRHVVVVERAASALAMHRLVARDRDSLERQTHRSLLNSLLSDGPVPGDLLSRAAAAGVPLDGRRLIGVAVQPRTLVYDTPTIAAQEVLRDVAEVTAQAAQRAGVPALVGVVDDTSVRALLALTSAEQVDPSLRRLARAVHRVTGPHSRVPPVVVAVGSTVNQLTDVSRSLAEAAHVAEAALRSSARGGAEAEPNGRLFHRLDDVRLRGLLHLLRDDSRVRAYVQRELGPLLNRDNENGRRLLEVLRSFCEHGGNKSAAAAAAHLSRPAYYKLLARIERILGVSLDDPESMLSLHVALLASESTRS
jgi:PucR family transcriptional regulator, purine catabolism regulatory protein